MKKLIPTPAASCVIKDKFGRFLLIKRGTPPQIGHWTIPGGRQEVGETLEETAVREVFEETGLEVRIIRKLGVLNLSMETRYRYEIHEFLAEPLAGALSAGDDAADIGWFSAQEMTQLELTQDLIHHLTDYGVYSG